MRKGNGIKPLSDLFAKYTSLLSAPQSSVIAVAVEVIEDVCGVTVPLGQVSYSTSTRTLSLRVSGPIKTEVALHKTEILAHIAGRLGTKNTPKNIV